jgi:hypothetical protein
MRQPLSPHSTYDLRVPRTVVHLWSACPSAYGALMTYRARLECTDLLQSAMRRAVPSPSLLRTGVGIA